MLRHCLLICAAMCLACGSDDDLASCESFVECGGDPVGRWSAEQTCVGGLSDDEIAFREQCPDGDFVMYSQTIGQIVIEGDGTFELELVVSTTVELGYLPDCVESLSRCDEIDETCTGEPATGCTCAYTVTDASTEASEWTTMGTVLDLDGVTGAYCASANQLMLEIEEPSGAVFTLSFSRDSQ